MREVRECGLQMRGARLRCSLSVYRFGVPPPSLSLLPSLSVMLMAVYFIIATAFFFHPNAADDGVSTQKGALSHSAS
jgi:hypothetical protein